MLLTAALGTGAATTINSTNNYAYGANIGWINWRGDVANGAVIGAYVCSGYIYAANLGWINLGSGSPPGGIYYSNTAAGDFGVNLDGLGNLRGYAWGANIGWLNFEANGAPKVDLATGKFSGYAWSANCGWISLSNAMAYVQTDTILAGTDSDGDGIPDAWELLWFGNLTTANASSDYDGDGSSDRQECLADTNPLDNTDYLRITIYTRAGTYNNLWWTSEPTRFYRVDRAQSLSPGSAWEELSLGYEGVPGWSNIGFDNTGPRYFYRVRAVRPLTH